MADSKDIVRTQTTGVRIGVYSQQNDPILLEPKSFDLRNKRGDGAYDKLPTVIGVSTSNVLGGGGSFAITCKPATLSEKTLLDQICDDDWVDIAFTLFDREHHVMRGLVDEVRRTRAPGGTGATAYTYTITGRDFLKVYQQTEMWFDMTTSEVIGDEAMYNITGGGFFSGRNPDEMVRALLVNAFKVQAKFGRANFAPPRDMPHMRNGSTFLQLLTIDSSKFTNTPSRRSVNANTLANPTGAKLWQLAQQWCDPMFCELFADTLAPGGVQVNNDGFGEPVSIEKGGMTIMFRDKPFPTVYDASAIGKGYKSGLAGEWFKLPTFIVPRGQLGSDDLGRNGFERFNAFIAQPNLVQEGMGTHYDMIAPLWDKGDINRHGIRRLDITTSYMSDSKNNLTATNEQRYLMRDWYAPNPYLLSGTLPLIVGRPDIRIGCRVRIPDVQGKGQDETFYIESVSNSWSLKPGVRTSLGVTRGFTGTDQELINLVQKCTSRYETAPPAVAGADDSQKVANLA